MSPESTTPTIVLVHGAFAESAGWADVIAELREQGYSAIAVANPLRGLEADAAYLRSVIDGIDGPVVVVGHSYGGAVMSIAADGADRVKALVYIASFNLEVGESAGELAAKFPGASSAPCSIPSRSRSPTAARAPTCTSSARSSTARSPPTSRRRWPS